MKDILSVVSNHHRGHYKNDDEKEFAKTNLEFLFRHINMVGVRLNLYRYKVDSQIYVVPEVYNNGKMECWSTYPVSEKQSTLWNQIKGCICSEQVNKQCKWHGVSDAN